MAVVQINAPVMGLEKLRSVDSTILAGQVRWPEKNYPQATSIYKADIDWVKISSGTSGDQTQLQINNLVDVPDEAFIIADVGIQFKAELATDAISDVMYSAAPQTFGRYVGYPLVAHEMTGQNWPDPETANTLNRLWIYQAHAFWFLRSRPLPGHLLDQYLPRFSWLNGVTWVSGDELHYSINLTLVGFPSSILGSGSLYRPLLEY